jgi:hypothetical protein
LSILFRTKGWLTLAQLLPAWASELAESRTNADRIERDLKQLLIEDIINGHLDDAGPLADGRRLGFRIITPENRAGYLEGHQARELITAGGTPAAFSFVSNRLLVLKEAVLDFARRHKVPPPSWWTDASRAANEQTGDLPVPEQPAAGEKPNNSAADQGARVASERSRAIKLEMTAGLFADLFWPVLRALGWIAFRDEARIEDSLRAATWYSVQAERPLRDANSQGTLLRVLQDGSLRALRDGKELPREAWANATGRNWPDDVRFRREDVLALWPVERERLLAQARASGSLEPMAQRNAGTGTARRRRKGPAPGTVDRYGDSDRALFPEIECIMREGHKSVHAVALELASAERVQGNGTPESRAKRLAMRFRKEHRPTATR